MHFDQAALHWDDSPMQQERALKVAEKIRSKILGETQLSALEFGCGTGLLSINLYKNLDKITLIDSSIGMIDVLKEKIRKNNLNKIQPMCLELYNANQLSEKYNLVYTSMALHHVEKHLDLLSLFYEVLEPKAKLFIIDLVEEDGSFHNHLKNFSGHNGFNLDVLANNLQDVGFKKIQTEIILSNSKTINGVKKEYPLFFMAAQKIV